jgi:tight adherence protein C
MATIISAAAFVFVALIVLLFGYRRYVMAGRVYESLGGEAEPVISRPIRAPEPEVHPVSRAAEFVGARLPPSAATASSLQRKLLAAGYREQNAVTIMYGLKLIAMAGIGLMMGFFALQSEASFAFRITVVLIGVLGGFKLPDFFLGKRINRRSRSLRRGLPDALDLFIICAEAGLTIDRCFRNVTHQLDLVHPELCSEFSLFTAEISAGLRRKDALENIAGRTQEKEIRKFSQVLIQADRFGTSMAEALRTHADYMRTQRRLEAEERAGKASVKLIFPIFFFIMPCMFLVTVGPAAVQIARQLTGLFTGKP